MFCPQCGTKATSNARFCKECGAEIGGAAEQADAGTRDSAQGQTGQSWGPSCGARFRGPSTMAARVIVKDTTMKTLLMAAGLLLLLPLAIPLIFGAVVASLFAGVALVATAVKLLPLLLVGLAVYLILSRQRRMPRSGY